MDYAFSYIKAKGIAKSSDYSYKGKNGTCRSPKRSQKVTSFTRVSGCAAMIEALRVRPLTVAVDGSNWRQYSTGVLTDCGNDLNHAGLLVGATLGFWKVKNSFGTKWGEGGYIRLYTGNTCSVCDFAGYPTL